MTHPAVTAAPGSAVELSGAIAEEVLVVGTFSDLSGELAPDRRHRPVRDDVAPSAQPRQRPPKRPDSPRGAAEKGFGSTVGPAD